MMYLFGLKDAKAAQLERVSRARRWRSVKGGVTDSFVRPLPEEADIIEVAFGRACDRDRIGA